MPYRWQNTEGQNLENRMKVVAMELLQELQEMDDRERYQAVMRRAAMATVPGFFQHRRPTQAELAHAAKCNAYTGPQQANGAWDLEKFAVEGWRGAVLRHMEDTMNNPATPEEMMRWHLLSKLQVENAIRAAGGRR